MKKKIILFSLFLLVAQMGFGQKNVEFKKLTPQEKQNFQKQVQKKVEELGRNLGILAGAPSIIKSKIIESQLRDFLKQAKIEIGNKRNGKLVKIKKPVKQYLQELKNYSAKQEIVNVEFASITVDSKLRKVPNKKDLYFFEYSYTQIFTKTKKIRRKNREDLKTAQYSYKDKTNKKGRMYLKQVKTVLGNKWKLFFGNVYVKNVEIL